MTEISINEMNIFINIMHNLSIILTFIRIYIVFCLKSVMTKPVLLKYKHREKAKMVTREISKPRKHCDFFAYYGF